MRNIVLCFVAMVLGCAMLSAQLPTRKEIERAVNPALSVVAKRGVRAEKSSIDLGIVDKSDMLTIRFTLSNLTGNKVAITELRSSCSCLQIATKPCTLGANEKMEVVAKFNPAGRSGKLKLDILVYTSLDAKSPTERLTITGMMATADNNTHLPYAMGELRLSRKSVVFDAPKVGATRIERIVVANTSQRAIRLTAHSTVEGLSLRCEPATLKPGEEGTLIISYTPKKSLNNIETLLILEGCSGRATDRSIKIMITK